MKRKRDAVERFFGGNEETAKNGYGLPKKKKKAPRRGGFRR